MVEGAPRGLQLIQHVLDAHLLIALGLDKTLGDVQEGVATEVVDLQVDSPRHRAPTITDRQPVYLPILLRIDRLAPLQHRDKLLDPARPRLGSLGGLGPVEDGVAIDP